MHLFKSEPNTKTGKKQKSEEIIQYTTKLHKTQESQDVVKSYNEESKQENKMRKRRTAKERINPKKIFCMRSNH